MTVRLLTEHHLEFLSITGDCTGSYESTLVKMPHCWKSRLGSNEIANNFVNIGSASSKANNVDVPLEKTQISLISLHCLHEESLIH